MLRGLAIAGDDWDVALAFKRSAELAQVVPREVV